MKWIDLPPVWLALFAALGWAQARYLPVLSFGRWGDWIGAALVLGGLGLMLAAAVEMRRHRTTIIPHQMPDAMVSSGIFGITRNPIYLGDALVLAGLGLRWDSILAILSLPVFVRLVTKRFIEGEEARLRQRFGPAFDDYSGRVRRWI